MKILVCIKQVPQKDAPLRLDEAKTWIRDDVSWETNEPDAYALEEALRQKEKHGGEVTAITAGPARAGQVLREALAKGADKAIHLEDDKFTQLDAANTTCRGIGENCSSGPQSGCCSMVCDKQTQRCDAGSATCAAQNGACTVDTDCCHGTCDTTTHTCQVACVAASGACTTDAECCSSVCTNGSCADLGSACEAVGSACTTGAPCCSDICTGGFCEQLIQ